MTNYDADSLIGRIAERFSYEIRLYLHSHLADINRANVDHRAAGGSGVCAVHDYFDTNRMMAAAFEIVTGRDSDPASAADAGDAAASANAAAYAAWYAADASNIISPINLLRQLIEITHKIEAVS